MPRQDVSFSTPAGRKAGGVLYVPGEGGRHPAVIVVHEWNGVTSQIRTLSARFADHGFVALAIDLYGGRVAKDDATAARLAQDMKTADAIDAIAGAVAALKTARVANGKVGAVGFCLGGAMALAAACNDTGLAAAVPYYGLPKAEWLKLGPDVPPVLGHYGERDTHVAVDRVRDLERQAVAAGAPVKLHYYPAGHAFARDTDEHAYEPTSAAIAWDRTVQFLRQKLT